jgi:hypothetical protein
MSISAVLREQVRQRAGCACEFCGVSEVDVGGLLTLDHFWPRSKGGPDTLENLLYACMGCNQFKQDYWPSTSESPRLWNPRVESSGRHWVELEDGLLAALTPQGEFTIRRLRLNRVQLVGARQRRRQQVDVMRLLQRYQEIVSLQAQVNQQLAVLSLEQQVLLREQREMLEVLLRQLGRE